MVIVVVFSVYSLFDVLAQTRTRWLSKPVWVLLALVPILGPLAWLALGRPPATRPGNNGGREVAQESGGFGVLAGAVQGSGKHKARVGRQVGGAPDDFV